MLRKELYNIKGQSLRLLRKLFTKQFNEHFYKSYFAEGFDTFFGYYDVNPVNLDESICLFSRVKKNSKKMEVGFNFLNDEGKDSIIIGNTELWCWQMGCRLQWLPNNKDKIVYNTILADNYGHLITDLNGKIIDKQQIPVYSISNSGEKFTTLNFSRLEKFRPGYGYNNITDNDLEIHAPKNDGIFISKIFSSETELKISLDQISRIDSRKSMINSFHYVNHLLFSPNDENILFFHFWEDQKKVQHRRVMLLNNNSAEVLISEDYFPSHVCWIDDTKIIITLAWGPEGAGYYRFDIDSKILSKIESISNFEDGHPTFDKNTNVLITDTVPDKYLDRKLLLYNLKENTKKVLLKRYSPPKLKGSFRCDFHPRISKTLICIDSAHKGSRGIYLFKY